MRGDPYDTVFDDWMEDKSDAVQIEAMMLADQSGSMAGMAIKQASKAFWIVASALDVIEAKVTQIGYSDSSYEIRGPKDRESSTQYKKMGTTGGTNPRVAIAKAAYELIDSEARHRLFIMYTDGGWYSTQDDEDILNMRKNGVTTVMFFLNTDGGWYSYTPPDVEDSRAHNCEYFYEITDGTQIADVASKLVIAMTKTAAASMGR
jgi:predicted metal-dependent peptidase